MGCPVVADRPAVGRNLQDHLQIRLIYERQRPITTNDAARLLLASHASACSGCCFAHRPAGGRHQPGRAVHARVRPTRQTPDIQFHVATLSAPTWPAARCTLFRASRCRCASCGPKPRATIRSAPPTRSQPPRDAGQLSVRREPDRALAVAGDKVRARACRDAAAEPYVAPRSCPGPQRDQRRRPARASRADTARRSSIPPAPAAWAATRCRVDRAARARRGAACGWSTARSCRRWCRATPTRPR